MEAQGLQGCALGLPMVLYSGQEACLKPSQVKVVTPFYTCDLGHCAQGLAVG